MNPMHTLIARAALSLLFVAGYGYIVVATLTAGDFSPAVKEVLIFLFGALTTSVVTIIQWWFGSAQGSAEKNVILSKTMRGSQQDNV